MSKVLRELDNFLNSISEAGNFPRSTLLQQQCGKLRESQPAAVKVAVTSLQPLSAANQAVYTEWLGDLPSQPEGRKLVISEMSIDELLRPRLAEEVPVI